MKRKLNAAFIVAFLILMQVNQVLAHGEDDGIAANATKSDWQDRLPILIIAIAIVIAVDSLFLVPIFRKLRSGVAD